MRLEEGFSGYSKRHHVIEGALRMLMGDRIFALVHRHPRRCRFDASLR
jgi:hypothetical protein